MSELSAIRNAVRAEETLAKGKAFSTIKPNAKNIVKTAAGAEVDISRGYNVRGLDGRKIPFNRDTPLEKAKEWTKNFYRKDFDIKPVEASMNEETGLLAKYTLQQKTDDGITRLDFDKDADGYRIRFAKVADDQRGKGVGAGMYRHLFEKAQKEGTKVFSDSGMSDESIAIWRRFQALGYPIKEHPNGRVPGRQYKMRTDKKAEEDAPIFEFDPSQMKAAGDKVPKADPLEKELYSAVRRKNLDPEMRNELTGLYLDYNIEEDAGAKAKLAERIRGMIKDVEEPPTVKMKKLDPGLYYDEHSKGYVNVDKDGAITPATIDEAR